MVPFLVPCWLILDPHWWTKSSLDQRSCFRFAHAVSSPKGVDAIIADFWSYSHPLGNGLARWAFILSDLHTDCSASTGVVPEHHHIHWQSSWSASQSSLAAMPRWCLPQSFRFLGNVLESIEVRVWQQDEGNENLPKISLFFPYFTGIYLLDFGKFLGFSLTANNEGLWGYRKIKTQSISFFDQWVKYGPDIAKKKGA